MPPKAAIPKSAHPQSPPKNSQTPAGGKGFLGRDAIMMCLYGPPGVGKTEFAAAFPDVGFVVDPKELGIKDLVDYGRCKPPKFIQVVESFKDLLKLNSNIANQEYSINTVVFDSLTGMESLCFVHHCAEYFDNDWSSRGFYSYQQGPKNAAKTDWPDFMQSLAAIQESGINVILIGHSQVKTYNNPEGADYDRFSPTLDKETWTQTNRQVQSIIFYNYHVDIAHRKGQADNITVKQKAKQSTTRYLYTAWSPAFDAKNRYGLPEIIEAGIDGESTYRNFVDSFPKKKLL